MFLQHMQMAVDRGLPNRVEETGGIFQVTDRRGRDIKAGAGVRIHSYADNRHFLCLKLPFRARRSKPKYAGQPVCSRVAGISEHQVLQHFPDPDHG